jgi:ATP-binding cassette subfamily F protein 3
MANDETILRFKDVSFGYDHNHPLLKEVNFSLRRGSKVTLMGQNGAGKTTLFELAIGTQRPEEGGVSLVPNTTVATAKQVIVPGERELTVRDFFARAFREKVYDLDPKIETILEVVHLEAPLERKIKTFSGGQQARLLLAFALIQNPDLLLLDEPTNNLDAEGIDHLKKFLIDYSKTCIVISHDADFLNSFTSGVLYLDAFTKHVEQYVGNYFDVVKEITRRIEREQSENARLQKEISDRKDKANFFAQKGGHMRDVARKMKEKIDELEEEKVDVRREDKTIRRFTIPAQADIGGEILNISSVQIIRKGKPVARPASLALRRKEKALFTGPNGIGKTSYLNALVGKTAKGTTIQPGIRIGYYRQDFSMLDYAQSVYASLVQIAPEMSEEELRSVAAGFLLNSEIIKSKIGALSEGQKGLLSFAQLVLMKPGLLILDEPTNHMNFRHIPVIAEALKNYEGALLLVSHAPDFVKKIPFDHIIDLAAL